MNKKTIKDEKMKRLARRKGFDLSRRELFVLAIATDEEEMSDEQCAIWRSGDVRMRIRAAVAEWAQLSPTVISSSQKLKDLAPPDDGPWSIAQQNNLIAVTNNQKPPIFHSVIPVDDQCEMEALEDLLSGDTSVLDWEGVVWANQDPETFCKRMFG